VIKPASEEDKCVNNGLRAEFRKYLDYFNFNKNLNTAALINSNASLVASNRLTWRDVLK